VQGDAVSAFQAGKILEQGGEFIHPHIEFLVGDVLVFLFQRFGNEVNGGLVLVIFQVTVDAVVAGVDLAALEPFEAGRVAGIQDLIPVFVPGQQVGIFLETVGEIVQAEPVVDALVRHVCLGDELCRRIIVSFFLPVNGNLRL
jgi:hypothetical protein